VRTRLTSPSPVPGTQDSGRKSSYSSKVPCTGQIAVSARRWSTTVGAGWRRWHDLPGESAPGRDNDQLPVTGAHCEGLGVSFLEDAEDVGDHVTAISCRPAPPDHDPLADVGGGEPDLKPVVHVGSLLAGWATCEAGDGQER
jgi:hypothetical protein